MFASLIIAYLPTKSIHVLRQIPYVVIHIYDRTKLLSASTQSNHSTVYSRFKFTRLDVYVVMNLGVLLRENCYPEERYRIFATLADCHPTGLLPGRFATPEICYPGGLLPDKFPIHSIFYLTNTKAEKNGNGSTDYRPQIRYANWHQPSCHLQVFLSL